MKKILIVNNNDSFIYNLVDMLRRLGVEFDIVVGDEVDFAELDHYSAFLFSPGAGIPKQYRSMMAIIERFHKTKPMFGVCLGHQAIAEFFGARLLQFDSPLHGHASKLCQTFPIDALFYGVGNDAVVGRYHSWVVDEATLPSSLKVIARDEEDNVMALRHTDLPIYGVQFHPESIITDECGKIIIKNWIEIVEQLDNIK